MNIELAKMLLQLDNKDWIEINELNPRIFYGITVFDIVDVKQDKVYAQCSYLDKKYGKVFGWIAVLDFATKTVSPVQDDISRYLNAEIISMIGKK